MAKDSLKRDVELIFELGCLRLMQRTWQRFHLTGVANLAEHHFRVAWIALIIAEHEGGVDIAKLLKMAMAHDITESRTGDLDYVSRAYAERREDEAIVDMLKGTVLAPELSELWREYEKLESLEAKIVKDADYIDIDAELAELRVSGNHDFADLNEPNRRYVGSKLKTESGKRLWGAVRVGHPLDWLADSKTALSAGNAQDQPKLAKQTPVSE